MRLAQELPTLSDGRYRLVDVLGQGGMATVYRAWDERLQVHRAVKILAPNLMANERLVERFESEARTMARLHHPNIVTVHDVARDGDSVFIVMELLEGGSLMDRLDRAGSLSPADAARFTDGILAGLGYAHEHRVVHRDIKPHNVLMGPGDTPKVTDFGIAQVSEGESSMTRTGAVMGTWAFMAPEMRLGARYASLSSDLYAVGATMYLLLTRVEPFDLYAVNVQDRLFAGLPGPFVDLLKQACAYDPGSRFANAAEMRAAIAGALALLPAAARDVPVPRDEVGGSSGLTLTPMGSAVGGTSETFSFDPVDASDGMGGLTNPPGAGPLANPVQSPGLAAQPETTTPARPAPILPRDLAPPGDVRGGTIDYEPPAAGETPSGGARGPLVALIIAAFALVSIGGWVFFRPMNPTPDPAADADRAAPVQPAAVDAPTTPAGDPAAPDWVNPMPERLKVLARDADVDAAPAPVVDGPPSEDADPDPTPHAAGPPAVSPEGPGPARTPATRPGREHSVSPARAPAGSAETPVEASALPGLLTLNSEPFSTVTLDGRELGRTPKVKVEVTAGAHSVRFVRADGTEATLDVTVANGDSELVCWDFAQSQPCR